MEKTINLEEVYKKLKMIEQSMVTKVELNRALETVMVESNDDTMRQIRYSLADLKAGRVRKINSVKDI